MFGHTVGGACETGGRGRFWVLRGEIRAERGNVKVIGLGEIASHLRGALFFPFPPWGSFFNQGCSPRDKLHMQSLILHRTFKK